MTLSDDGFKEVLNVVCTPSGKHSVGCNYGSAPDSLSVCNLAPDDPYLLQFLWECLNILPMDSLRSEEIEKTKDDSYYVLSLQDGQIDIQVAVYQINRKYTITVQKENLDPQWYHISVVPGELIWKKLKTIFENLPEIQMERFCTSLKSGDAAQLAVICYHSAGQCRNGTGTRLTR